MSSDQAAPDPVYYLTPGEPVTCLRIKNNTLYAGTAEGNIKTYSTQNWRLTGEIKAFR